ncbi:MAG: hypothetical protein ACFE0Q_01880 [Anaerolineae bacterium]
MTRFTFLCLTLALVMMVTACRPQATAVGELPTLVAFPTDTETPLPSDTPEVTATETATATETPTETSTPTATFTATATFIPSATWTRPPSATPTNTQTFTPTPSPTPEATLTPIPTRTPNTPMIENFQSNRINANNGDPITLRWVVQAESARLEVINSTGTVTEAFDVNLVGSYSSNTPTTGNVVTYRLTAIRGVEEVRSIITVDMESPCLTAWYFPNPPSGTGCAASPVETVQVFFQEFERGFMFRTDVNGQARVCGVQFDRNLYSCFSYQAYTGTPTVTPPTGFLVPDALVAHTFYNNLATGGFWYDVIGWGTGTGSTISVQRQVSDSGRAYYQFPNGIYPFDQTLTSAGSATARINTP